MKTQLVLWMYVSSTLTRKFENSIFVMKTDKMFSVHIIIFEEIVTEIITHLAGIFKFIHFGGHFHFCVTENAVLFVDGRPIRINKWHFQIYLA